MLNKLKEFHYTCKRCGKEYIDWGYSKDSDPVCWGCRKEAEHDQMKEAILAGEEDEPWDGDGYYCPYCGEFFEIDDDYELYNEGEHEMKCYNCGKTFVIETEVRHTFTTSKMR